MKQMGHSEAFLYRKASTRWPFTYGSLGRCSSSGAMSDCEALREPVAREASVLARPRKNGEEEELFAIGDAGEGREKVGFEGERPPPRAPMGTVSLLRLGSELRGFHAVLRWLFVFVRGGSSGGISSAAGSGRPLTTSTS